MLSYIACIRIIVMGIVWITMEKVWTCECCHLEKNINNMDMTNEGILEVSNLIIGYTVS